VAKLELAQVALAKNKKELIPNTIFLLVIFLLSMYTFVGKFGFWILLISVGFQVLRYLFTLVLGLILLFINVESSELKIIKWKTTFIMTIEIIIDLVFLIPLYQHFY
jgi:hypothetical protein